MMERANDNNIVKGILKEIGGFDPSNWNKEKNEFNCLIHREDVGEFKCHLRVSSSSPYVELLLTSDNVMVSIAKFEKNDKDNRVVKMFNDLDKYFKKKSKEERERIIDRFLNKP